jgi:hypothetical protein
VPAKLCPKDLLSYGCASAGAGTSACMCSSWRLAVQLRKRSLSPQPTASCALLMPAWTWLATGDQHQQSSLLHLIGLRRACCLLLSAAVVAVVRRLVCPSCFTRMQCCACCGSLLGRSLCRTDISTQYNCCCTVPHRATTG